MRADRIDAILYPHGYHKAAELDAPEPVAPAAPKGRPAPLTVIAVFQWVKAAVLLYALSCTMLDPAALRFADVNFRAVIWFAANGHNPNLYVLPVLCAYAMAIGFGMVFIQNWARKTLIASSIAALCLHARNLFAQDTLGLGFHFSADTLGSPWDRELLYALIAVDGALLIYLWMHDEAFVHNR